MIKEKDFYDGLFSVGFRFSRYRIAIDVFKVKIRFHSTTGWVDKTNSIYSSHTGIHSCGSRNAWYAG